MPGAAGLVLPGPVPRAVGMTSAFGTRQAAGTACMELPYTHSTHSVGHSFYIRLSPLMADLQ